MFISSDIVEEVPNKELLYYCIAEFGNLTLWPNFPTLAFKLQTAFLIKVETSCHTYKMILTSNPSV
jgi:hypothetical protein